MTKEELDGKTFDVFPSQMILLIQNNALLHTILNILIETNQLDKAEIMTRVSKNSNIALDDLVSISDKD